MPLSEDLRERLSSIVGSHDVVLFMKGSRMMPQCGFSGKCVQILDGLLPEYETVDVLSDPDVRDGIKEFSNWPTIPQLYLKGEFIGGCDIITDLYNTGELHTKLGVEAPERKIPKIEITDTAAERIREFAERAPGKELSLSIDARNQPSLGLVPPQGTEIEVIANGIKVLMDLGTASRADGARIDLVESKDGAGFKIDIPSGLAEIKQVSATEVKKMIDDGVKFDLFDVRTPEEYEIASIEGARLVDPETAKYIESLPKDTLMVFHCHHGGRSQSACEHFRELGFTNLHNMSGGINAWAAEVDPDVPRY
jgi:monothiol glutaredoxin